MRTQTLLHRNNASQLYTQRRSALIAKVGCEDGAVQAQKGPPVAKVRTPHHPPVVPPPTGVPLPAVAGRARRCCARYGIMPQYGIWHQCMTNRYVYEIVSYISMVRVLSNGLHCPPISQSYISMVRVLWNGLHCQPISQYTLIVSRRGFEQCADWGSSTAGAAQVKQQQQQQMLVHAWRVQSH